MADNNNKKLESAPNLRQQFTWAAAFTQFLFSVFSTSSGDFDLGKMLQSLSPIGTAHAEMPGRAENNGAHAHVIPVPPDGGVDHTGKVKPGQGIVTYGDSLAVGFKTALARQFNNVTNMGISGTGLLTPHKMKNLDGVDLHNKTVLVSVGTNDAGMMGRSPAELANYEARYGAMIDKIIADGGTPVIIGARHADKPLLTQTQAQLANWNRTLDAINGIAEKVAAERGVTYATSEAGINNRAFDGVHYDEEGYRKIADNALQQAQASPSQKPKPLT